MSKMATYANTIDYLVSIMRQVEDEKNYKIRKGEYVNVFTLWNSFSGLSEPVHSRILHFFLSSNPMHGQGNLFLGLFLKCIGIDDFHETDEWVVTAEAGRVDVLLKRYHPHHSVVIIENKSNWAGDQPNQLYRYWYHNIHRSKEDCYSNYYDRDPGNKYKIVYLVPKAVKTISDNSRQRPKDYSKDLPPELPLKPIVYSFDKELVEWLDDCIASLPVENTPLINLILQYKEYCKKL